MSSALYSRVVTDYFPAIALMQSTKTVLVVDDNPQSRELLRIVLEQAGHDVVEAGDGHYRRDGQSQIVHPSC